MISFKTTKQETLLIADITRRAVEMSMKAGNRIKAMDLNMDISACHANGCPLKLGALLTASDFDFAHDVFGIHRHIDRETGKLTDCFLPRYAN